MRKTLIAGNWKMYKTPSETEAFLQELAPKLAAATVALAVFPTSICLPAAAGVLTGTNIRFGGQNIHVAEEGAYTGEISAAMLRDTGAEMVLCGHSERRQYFGESDDEVAQKAAQAWKHGLVPVICIGESEAQRQAGQAQQVIASQLEGSLATWDGKLPLVLAYEPVWAIGTGLTATPEDAQEICAFIRQWVQTRFGAVSETLQILYGGSVKPANTKELMACPDIDGALVGGASLQVDSFAAIVAAAQ